MLFMDKELPKNIKSRTKEIYKILIGKAPKDLSVIVSSNLGDVPDIAKELNQKLNSIIDPSLKGKQRQRAKEKIIGRMMTTDESAFFPQNNIIMVSTDTPKDTPGTLAHEMVHSQHQQRLGGAYDMLRSGWAIPEAIGVAGTLAGAITKNKKLRNISLAALIPATLLNIIAPIIDEYITSKRGGNLASLSKEEKDVLKKGLSSYVSTGGKNIARAGITIPILSLL